MCQCKSQESQGNCLACAPKKTIPHVQAALIKAWADGAVIQGKAPNFDRWVDITETPVWRADCKYRIKPEPKPVVVRYVQLKATGEYMRCTLDRVNVSNLKYLFDGETGELKAVELL